MIFSSILSGNDEGKVPKLTILFRSWTKNVKQKLNILVTYLELNTRKVQNQFKNRFQLPGCV